jgi:hypothetical protein
MAILPFGFLIDIRLAKDLDYAVDAVKMHIITMMIGIGYVLHICLI